MTHQVQIAAPAKLNLGLEVIGRRPDGFHDIVTVFQAISLADTLSLTPASAVTLTSDDATLASDDNLIVRAMTRLRAASGATAGAAIHLAKRIPVAAGLGGASSNAASALLAGRQLWGAAVPDAHLHRLAAELGSDVPFFLRGGTALGTGRGGDLTPLAPLTGVWFVVVSPQLAIPRKTPSLYATLEPGDFSDGMAVRRLASRVADEPRALPDALPPNAFARPLYALWPDLADLPAAMRAAGAVTVGLSGAGPSHFALVDDPDRGAAIVARLHAALGDRAAVTLATPVNKPPAPVATYLP